MKRFPKNSWLTGTAAWSFAAVSQGILGIKPDYDGLVVDPCLPSSIDGYRLRRYFRGTVYDITVRRGTEPGMTVDGKPVKGNKAPLTSAKECAVEVTI